jgi:hypothetical protein
VPSGSSKVYIQKLELSKKWKENDTTYLSLKQKHACFSGQSDKNGAATQTSIHGCWIWSKRSGFRKWIKLRTCADPKPLLQQPSNKPSKTRNQVRQGIPAPQVKQGIPTSSLLTLGFCHIPQGLILSFQHHPSDKKTLLYIYIYPNIQMLMQYSFNVKMSSTHQTPLKWYHISYTHIADATAVDTSLATYHSAPPEQNINLLIAETKDMLKK